MAISTDEMLEFLPEAGPLTVVIVVGFMLFHGISGKMGEGNYAISKTSNSLGSYFGTA